MVLDLMLANIDQLFWGWSDPNAIYLLDFWKSVDPKIAFILVYDKPESVFTRYDISSYSSEENYARDRLKAWSAYNTELLNFYRKNQDRCFLVHAQQVRLSAASYIQQLKVRIGKSLKFPDKILWKGTEISCQEDNSKRTAKSGKTSKYDEEQNQQTAEVAIASSKAILSYADNPNDNSLSRYIAKALTHSNKQAQKVYKELQESANLPLINEGVEGIAAIDAWQAMVEQIYKTQTQSEQIQTLTEQLNRTEQNAQDTVCSLENEISRTKATCKEAENRIEFLKQEQVKQLESLQSKINEHSKKADNAEKQEAKLSQNIKQVENLAKERFEQLEQLKKQLEESKKIAANKESQAKELEAKNRELQAISTPQNNEFEQENDMLLSQLHQVQEELEKYYLENQELKKSIKQIKPKLYGAKERVKNTLEYRIGGLMIEHWKYKGKLTLLFAVKKMQKEWKSDENFSPLEDYADAEEGYKTQKHLSYRLGRTWLNHKNILTLPKAILKDVREFRDGLIVTKINILWISPTPLFPTNSGNRRHLKYMIEAAEKNEAFIDFILYGWEKEAMQYHKQLKKKFNQFFYFPQPTKKDMTYGDYYGIDDWVSSEFMAFVREKRIAKKYNVVFVEYVWMSKIFEIFDTDVVKVLDTHDIFSNRDFLLEK
ncbi:MAG: hypothetical protein LBJ88_01505 [Campylobacteraceae bacterium]|jgi:hypothetical protein|nr:hypothetical protein [Campylobacteraceae bacterium]